MSIPSRLLLVIAAVLLGISIFVPIWRIDLQAPQYPEGLMLQIRSGGIGGDVDIINGLNHYIGMKTLHSNDFIEFTILPFLIGFYALLFLVAALRNNRKWLYACFGLFVLFGIVAMVDFWRWEYNYGHNLDPNAAIVVPGMAYQPPLIGFKQLLNFGAFSMPDIGGWLFIGAGVLVLAAVVLETRLAKRMGKNRQLVMAILLCGLFAGLTGCSPAAPVPIQLNKDACDFCKMTISDGRLATEITTAKGRTYKFDDLHCMLAFEKEQEPGVVKHYYVNDYAGDNVLIDATTAWFVELPAIKSPMGGNTAAFRTREEAAGFAKELAPAESWAEWRGRITKNESHAH